MSPGESAISTRTVSASDTRALAGAIAGLARPGDLVLLIGDLGAGKTAFAQGFATGLKVTDRVTSPTFALLQSYEGTMVMNHLDVYRLSHIRETDDLGLSELLDGDSVTLIEWGDTIRSALPRDYLQVTLALGDSSPNDCADGDVTPRDLSSDDRVDRNPSLEDPSSDDPANEVRRIDLLVRGSSWRPRLAALRRVLEPWMTSNAAAPSDQSAPAPTDRAVDDGSHRESRPC